MRFDPPGRTKSAEAFRARLQTFDPEALCDLELEGADDVPYEDAQYEALVALIQALRAALPSLAGGDIVGHSDIAPGRKTDPGSSFDWLRYRTEIGSELC